MNFIRAYLDYFENNKAPIGNFIAAFLFFVLLRNFIEVYATHQDNYLLQTLTYSPFYIALACWLIVLIYFFTRDNIIKVSKIVLSFFVIILLPPVLDVIISGSGHVRMKYVSLSGWESLIRQYFMLERMWNSLGQKIEIVIALTGAFIFFRMKGKSIWLSAVFALLIHTCFFLFSIAMWLMNEFFLWTDIPPALGEDNFFLARFYFIVAVIGLLVIFYLHNSEKFKMLVKDIRPMRITHYLMMVALGIALLQHHPPKQMPDGFTINSETFFYFFLIFISGIFGAVFSIISNNAQDVAIDRISNPHRPLAANRISEKEYMGIGYISLVFSLVAAVLVNRSCFIFMALVLGSYYIYSNPPFKLKRIPILSKLMIGVNSAFMTLMGYTVFGGSVLSFPPEFLFFLVICIGLSSNFIDLKDYEGDKSAGIKTLPVLAGIRNAKILISIFMVFSYSVVYYILQDKIKFPVLLLLIPVGAVLHVFFLNRKKFQEEPVFITYLLGSLFLVLILFYGTV